MIGADDSGMAVKVQWTSEDSSGNMVAHLIRGMVRAKTSPKMELS